MAMTNIIYIKPENFSFKFPKKVYKNVTMSKFQIFGNLSESSFQYKQNGSSRMGNRRG